MLQINDLIKNNVDTCINHFEIARQLKSKGDIKNAIEEINIALKSFGLIDANNILGVYHPNNKDKFTLFPVNLKQLLAQTHFLAGELYAMVDNVDESLKHYQFHHYYCFQTGLPDELKDKESVVLYSFRKYGEYSLGDIINNQITLCHPSLTNDPFDSIANLWTRKEDLERRCNEKKHIEPFNKSFDYFRIRSFVADRKHYRTQNSILKNILMWSHYTDQHKGFCIKYRLSKQFIKSAIIEENNAYFRLLSIKPIHYITDFSIDDDRKSIDTDLSYYTKSKCWQYENEVRLLCFDTSTNDRILSIMLDDESRVEEITFGYRSEKDTIKTIQSIVHNMPIYKNVMLSRMNQDIRTGIYNLTKEKI